MEDFIKVPLWALKKIPEIGPEAFAVYCLLLSHADNETGLADLGGDWCCRFKTEPTSDMKGVTG